MVSIVDNPGSRLNFDGDTVMDESAEVEVVTSNFCVTLVTFVNVRVVVTEPKRTPPLAFPLLVDRAREAVSSESLADRVRRMQLALERAA